MTKELSPTAPIAEATGNVAIVELYPHKVTVRQRNALTALRGGIAGSTDIWIDAISGVQIQKPNILKNGCLRIMYAGSARKGNGLTSPSQDEFAVWFKRGKWEEFAEFKRHLDDAMMAQRTSDR